VARQVARRGQSAPALLAQWAQRLLDRTSPSSLRRLFLMVAYVCAFVPSAERITPNPSINRTGLPGMWLFAFPADPFFPFPLADLFNCFQFSEILAGRRQDMKFLPLVAQSTRFQQWHRLPPPINNGTATPRNVSSSLNTPSAVQLGPRTPMRPAIRTAAPTLLAGTSP
jgi:hypothetical protein